MINSPNDIWEHVLEILREKLTQVAINTWFNECSVLSVTDSRLVLCIPSDFKRNIVESRFKVDIMNALRELFSTTRRKYLPAICHDLSMISHVIRV